MKRLIYILGLSVGTALGIIISLEQSAIAQVNTSQPAGGEYQSNEQDSNSSSSFGNSFNPLDLIHNSNLRRSRDAQQFDEDSQNTLNQAAEEFKRKQQERLQNQSNPNPSPSP